VGEQILVEEALQSGSGSFGLQHATLFLSDILPSSLH